MSDPTITPALTPEEWAAGLVTGPDPRGQARLSGSNELLWVRADDKVSSWSDENRHALAALALHGQPFGFTHADVAFLRSDVHEMVDQRTMTERDEARLASLAARIEALLCPEDPKP